MTLTTDVDLNKINTLFNGFFLLSEQMWLNEGKKVPKQKRDTPLFVNFQEIPSDENYIAGEFRDGLVVLDFDIAEQGEFAVNLIKLVNERKFFDKPINCNVVKTERGWHLYFRNPSLMETPKGHVPKKMSTGSITTTGLACEYKLGAEFGKNGDYEPLLLGETKREWVGTVFEFGELSELPFIFWHYKRRDSIFNLAEGSRNNVLSEFAVGLQKILNRKQIEIVCRIINSAIFKEPLPSKEVDVILSDRTFQNKNLEAVKGIPDKL